MRKISVLLLMIALGFTFTACDNPVDEPNPTEYFVLPDLNGYNKEEIMETFDFSGQAYTINEFEQENEQYELQFIMYENFDTGDIVDITEIVEILIYPEYTGVEQLSIYPI